MHKELNPRNNSAQVASKSIKKGFESADWWKLVQSEVKERLSFIIDNLDMLGLTFRNTFVEYFKHTHALRVLRRQSIRAQIPSVLFGRNMTEECFQSGIIPTKVLLDLNDWVKPNDADVQACFHLCQQIEVLETLGVFGEIKEKLSQIDQAIKETNSSKKKKARKKTHQNMFDKEKNDDDIGPISN